MSLAIEQFVAATAGRAAQETSPDDETVGPAMHVTSPLQDEQPNVAANNYPTFAEAYKVAALDVMNKMRTFSPFRA